MPTSHPHPLFRKSRSLPGLAALLLLLLPAGTGCAHYRLGNGASPPFATLHVDPPANKTHLAQSQALLGTQIREAFERDGRVSLVDGGGNADATLEVTVTDYHRDIIAGREDDTGLGREMNLTLGVTCTLRDNRTGKTLFSNRFVSVQKETFVDNGLGAVPFGLSNDQLQAEYNTLPLLGNALADRIAHTVLDVW